MSQQTKLAKLKALVTEQFSEHTLSLVEQAGELTLSIGLGHLFDTLQRLKSEAHLNFSMLMDLTAVDYLHYGQAEWETQKATGQGFDRAVQALGSVSVNLQNQEFPKNQKARYALVYHLLSLSHNWRLRVKAFIETDPPIAPSVLALWPSANWYEREVFDLFGILFDGHPDLRRILTDYGFIGHPFRKDFPLSGHVEVIYDEVEKRVVYQPVSIEPRVLVPKVIREDNRYA
ncbi:MAG: NADH-quinone oxidoreductase subunit C [Gammaproteobacteria bacterium]